MITEAVVHSKPYWELCDPVRANMAKGRGEAVKLPKEVEEANARHYASADYCGAAIQPVVLLKPGGSWVEPVKKPPPKKKRCPHGREKSKCKECKADSAPSRQLPAPPSNSAMQPVPLGLPSQDSIDQMDQIDDIDDDLQWFQGAVPEPTPLDFGPVDALAAPSPIVAEPQPRDDGWDLPVDAFDGIGKREIPGMLPQGSVDPALFGPGQISSSSSGGHDGTAVPLPTKGMAAFMAAPPLPKPAEGGGGAQEDSAAERKKKRREMAARAAGATAGAAAAAAAAAGAPPAVGLARQETIWLPFKEKLFSQTSAHPAACRICKQGPRELGTESFNSRVCIVCDDAANYGQVAHYPEFIPKEKQAYKTHVVMRAAAGNAVHIPYAVHLCDKHYAHYEESGEQLKWAGPYRSDASVKKERILPMEFFAIHSWSPPNEQWIKCDSCGEECHHRCVMFDKDVYKQEKVTMLCPNPTCTSCASPGIGSRDKDRNKVRRTADQLPETPLSVHLENEVRDNVFGGAGSEKITIRLVSNVEREQLLPAAIIERYNITEELRYQQKYLMAFVRNPDGTDVAFFAMQVLEYSEANNALEQYQNCAYIAYIESIGLYHLPKCAVNKAGKYEQECSCPKECHRERSRITQAIFQGYLRYLQLRQFQRAYLWAMAPLHLDSDFLFHMRPRDAHFTKFNDVQKQQNLENWYRNRLMQAKDAGIITGFSDNAPDEAGKRGNSEGVLFHAEEDGDDGLGEPEVKEAAAAASDGRGRKRRAPDQYRPEEESKKPQFASEAGPAVSMSKLMVFPGDSVTEDAISHSLIQTKKATRGGGTGALDRMDSKKASKKFISRVSNDGNGSHFVCHFKPVGGGAAAASPDVEIEDDPTVNIDDEGREKTLNDRDNLVGLCTVKHYQFDTMRTAKYSTMMLLQHFMFPKFAPEITHRPVLSRQRSSRTGFPGRQVTSEIASTSFIIEQLSHPDDIDRRILGAIKSDVIALKPTEWPSMESAHRRSLEDGLSKPARVVRLVQHSIKLLGLRTVILKLLELLPTNADILAKTAMPLKGRMSAAAFKSIEGATRQQLASSAFCPPRRVFRHCR